MGGDSSWAWTVGLDRGGEGGSYALPDGTKLRMPELADRISRTDR
jgi:hypothetical protein